MQQEIYEAPKANLETSSVSNTIEFYVVSKAKFYTLYFSTIGIYLIYWFYKNWRIQKDTHNLDVWPVPRAIFPIFFVHRLFDRIDSSLISREKEIEWTPSGPATLYVVLAIVGAIADNLSGRGFLFPYLEVTSFVSMIIIAFVIFSAQNAINISQDDARGERNSHFSLANIAWIVFGILFWMAALWGYSELY